MRKCGNAEVWECGNVGMRKCGNAEVWECVNVGVNEDGERSNRGIMR